MTENSAVAVDEIVGDDKSAETMTTLKVDDGLAHQMSEIIVNIVKSSDGNLGHPALASTADEHSAEEIAELLKFCKIDVAAVDAEVAAYHMTLDEAKKIALETLTEPEFEAPSDGDAGSILVKKEEKTARKATGKKASAKKREPKAVEAVRPNEVVKIASAGYALPEKRARANLVQPWPATFFTDKTEKKPGTPHQVDPGRTQGYAPVMPNISLLEKTGNPYPQEADETVKTSGTYAPFVSLSHWTYLAFSNKEGNVRASDKEFVAEVLKLAGNPDNASQRACITDTLRDLALFGLCEQFRQGRARIFRKL